MNIRVTIDRLVLEGFRLTAAERETIQSSIETELARLMRVDGVPPVLRAGATVESIGAPAIRMDSRASKTGRHIAQSVFRGMGAK